MRAAQKLRPLLWAKRLLLYFGGLFFIAAGVVISAKPGLGVSPVGSPANVLYQIGLDRGLPERFFNLGNWTIAVYCVYILAQIALLGRRYRPVQLLQLGVTFVFGALVNLTGVLLRWLPEPGSYAVRLAYLVVSIPVVALGVMMYLVPRLLPTPGRAPPSRSRSASAWPCPRARPSWTAPR